MNKTVSRLTLCAVLSAFSVAFIYISSVSLTGQLGFTAIASLFCIVAVIEFNMSGGLLVYICSSLLSFLLVPDRSAALLYILFFGYYPIIKHIAECLKNRFFEWLLKLFVLNIALAVIVFAFYITIFNLSYLMNSYILLILAANIIFIIFDIGVTKMIEYYIIKISPKIRKK